MSRLKDWINQIQAKLSLKNEVIAENNSIPPANNVPKHNKELVNKVLLLMSRGTRGAEPKTDLKPSSENNSSTPKPKP